MVRGFKNQFGQPTLESCPAGSNTVYFDRNQLGTPTGMRIGTTDYTFVLDGIDSTVNITK
jgi:hypothetical protein